MELEKSLYAYLDGMLEDDPLADEIGFVYFIIVEDKASFHLEVKGSEIKNKSVFEYNPLEGQYFFYDYPNSEEVFVEELRLAIKNLPFFDDRQVFILYKGKLIKP